MSRYPSSYNRRDNRSFSHSRRDGHSQDRSRSPHRKRTDQSTAVTVNLDGNAAKILANDDEELKRLNADGSVHVKREMEGFKLKMSFSGPDRNVHDIMMGLYRYLENIKNIKCPR